MCIAIRAQIILTILHFAKIPAHLDCYRLTSIIARHIINIPVAQMTHFLAHCGAALISLTKKARFSHENNEAIVYRLYNLARIHKIRRIPAAVQRSHILSAGNHRRDIRRIDRQHSFRRSRHAAAIAAIANRRHAFGRRMHCA